MPVRVRERVRAYLLWGADCGAWEQLHEPRGRMGGRAPMGRAKLPARFQSNAQFPPFHPAARECLECLSFSYAARE